MQNNRKNIDEVSTGGAGSGVDYFDDDNNLLDYRGEPQTVIVENAKRLYYTPSQAAEKLGWRLDDLMHYGETSQVDFFFRIPSKSTIDYCVVFDNTSENFEMEVDGSLHTGVSVFLGSIFGSDIVNLSKGKTIDSIDFDVLFKVDSGKLLEIAHFDEYGVMSMRFDKDGDSSSGSSLFFPTFFRTNAATITVDDLYITYHEIRRVMSGGKREQRPENTAITETWHNQVIGMALDILKDKPNILDKELAPMLIEKCKNLGIKNQRGRELTQSTITRHAIQPARKRHA